MPKNAAGTNLFGTVAGVFAMLSFSRSRALAVLCGNAVLCAILFSSGAARSSLVLRFQSVRQSSRDNWLSGAAIQSAFTEELSWQ
jgi:hypothetical protein